MLRAKSVKYLLIINLTFLVLASCGNPLAQPTPTPTVLAGGAALQLHCPEEDTLFSLWFSHFEVLDINAGDGETFHLEFENIPPSYFDLWIFADGSISNEGVFREAPVGYHGIANHPDDDNCPVQTFDGITQMKATITGTCKYNMVQIHIVEEWIDPSLNSDCGSAIGPGPGLYSAPELDLVFDLNDPYPSDFVQIPEGGPFHATYAYHLWLAGYDLPIVPLVPEDQ